MCCSYLCEEPVSNRSRASLERGACFADSSSKSSRLSSSVGFVESRDLAFFGIDVLELVETASKNLSLHTYNHAVSSSL